MLLDMTKKPVVIFNLGLLLLCLITPLLSPYLEGGEFYMSVMARIMIWAIAAISLNLIMGYGGMISFGHAVYIGIGGYVIAVSYTHLTLPTKAKV